MSLLKIIIKVVRRSKFDTATQVSFKGVTKQKITRRSTAYKEPLASNYELQSLDTTNITSPILVMRHTPFHKRQTLHLGIAELCYSKRYFLAHPLILRRPSLPHTVCTKP